MAFGSLSGDFSALDRFSDAIGNLGSSKVMTDLNREIGAEVVKLTERGFDREQDPYGLPWHRKAWPDGRKTLQGSTGKLAKSFSIKAVGPWGVVVASSLARSRFPQAGTGVYGPSKQRIKPKAGKALAFKSGAGATLFRASFKGQQQRRLVPVQGLPSPTWNRALASRARAFILKRLGKVARVA
jgi:hypothetical protein